MTETTKSVALENIDQLVTDEMATIRTECAARLREHVEQGVNSRKQAMCDEADLNCLKLGVEAVLGRIIARSEKLSDFIHQQRWPSTNRNAIACDSESRQRFDANVVLFQMGVSYPFSVSIHLIRMKAKGDGGKARGQLGLFGNYDMQNNWYEIEDTDWSRSRPVLEPKLRELTDPAVLTKTIVRALYFGTD